MSFSNKDILFFPSSVLSICSISLSSLVKMSSILLNRSCENNLVLILSNAWNMKLQGHQHLGYSPTWSWKIEDGLPLFIKPLNYFQLINKFLNSLKWPSDSAQIGSFYPSSFILYHSTALPGPRSLPWMSSRFRLLRMLFGQLGLFYFPFPSCSTCLMCHLIGS